MPIVNCRQDTPLYMLIQNKQYCYFADRNISDFHNRIMNQQSTDYPGLSISQGELPLSYKLSGSSHPAISRKRF